MRAFGRQSLFEREGDEWSFKAYGPDLRFTLCDLLGLSREQWEIVAALLKFCQHVLSSRRVGATLVWHVQDGPLDGLSRSPRSTPVELQLSDSSHFDALASLLASVDGACLVKASGEISGYEAFLDNSKTLQEIVPSIGGTRHTTAARYSFDEPGVIVFVVSADGPVSVFSDGVRVMRLSDSESVNPAVRSWLPTADLNGDVRTTRTICATCGKTLLVDTVIGAEADGPTESRVSLCPVCGSVDSEVDCMGLAVRVVKLWDGSSAVASPSLWLRLKR